MIGGKTVQGECFLCKQYGIVERHHIFGGSNRQKSEKYGLVVSLCKGCHTEPPNGVHHNKEKMEQLHKFGQKRFMIEQNLDAEEFKKIFYKNYL